MPISKETRDGWNLKVKAVKQSLDLNDWESYFIDSIQRTLLSGKDISMKQSLVLNIIYNRVY